jgi:hypothetical protein
MIHLGNFRYPYNTKRNRLFAKITKLVGMPSFVVRVGDFIHAKKRKNVYMVDYHDHTWSKNKKLFPILFCVLFVVLAGVVIKLTILKKGKPQSRKERHLARLISTMR